MTLQTPESQVAAGGAVTLAVGGPAAEWARGHREEVARLLLRHGYLVLSEAGVRSADDVVALRDALGWGAAGCPDRFAARADHGSGVYSWPEWAAGRDMCWHHEQSQGLMFPRHLVLGALSVPEDGAQLLLADTRRVLSRLPAPLLERFTDQGWRLERTFRPYLGLAWTEAFGVAEAEAAEAVFERLGVEHTWAEGSLTTVQKRSAVAVHPDSGEACWFNDVAFFNQWSVPPAERDVLLSAFGARGFPANTFSGDGAELTESDYDALLEAYAAVGVRATLQPGDAVLVDNMLTAHGREPYAAGAWDVIVAMASETRAG